MVSNILTTIINQINSVLKIKETPNFGKLPAPLISETGIRNGMSVKRVFSKYLEMKKQLNIPTGNLEDGTPNYEEILIYTLIQAILDEMRLESKINTAIRPGQNVVASGGNAGGPITVYGVTTTYGTGGTTIE